MDTKFISEVLGHTITLVTLYVLLYLINLFPCQLGCVTAPLDSTISHVGRSTTHKEMMGIYTFWVVTLVEHFKPLRNWLLVVNLPRDPVGICHPSRSAQPETAIPFVIKLGHPYPTGSFIHSWCALDSYFIKESLCVFICHACSIPQKAVLDAPFLNG